ncbi:MAG: bpX6 domain-containing protein [Gammaproteobacteria bacterium]|nr:bpX6 domain-containing protein [Gammaproteobacteria bacterium]MDH5800623.1 bpX6 domain-containing protein [Gammaproteobacteria bacterium]
MTKYVFCGHHQVQGFYFPISVAELKTRKRILTQWQHGLRVFRHPQIDGVFVLFQKSLLQDCDAAPGYALVKRHGVWTNAMIRKEDALESNGFGETLLLMFHGSLRRISLSDAIEEDVSAWIDVSGIKEIQVQSMGRLPELKTEDLLKEKQAVYKLFSNEDLKPAPEQEEFIRSLSGKPDSSKQNTTAWTQSFFSLKKIIQFIFSRNGQVEPNGGTSYGNPSGGMAGGIFDKFSALFKRLVMSSNLGKFLSKRQARYFRGMLDKFESGDIHDALRHAIPLASARDAFNADQPELGLPKARADLKINFSSSRSSGSFQFEHDFYDYLRKLYRSVFERLDRAGKIEEAAFVLAELLQATEEAVSYLEKHGELRLAAKLAEGREANPALVIRQWFLAGEVGRAIQIAKRTRHFSQAVQRMQQSHPMEADKLRLLWAHSLVEAGQYAAAVDVVWSLESARALVWAWAGAAIEEGGESGARMLARKIAYCPDEYPELREQALRVLDGDTKSPIDSYQHPMDQAARMAFAKALLQEPQSIQSRAIARQVYRSMLRDYGLGLMWNTRDLDKMSLYAQERALRADMPTSPHGGGMVAIQSELPHQSITHMLSDSGTTEVWCAQVLPKLRMLLARGEAGVTVMNFSGKQSSHYAEPAHQLVLVQTGNRAIAIAQRGEFMRLAKLNLSAGSSRFWCDVKLSAWCDCYDGIEWFAAQDNRLMAVDAQADEFRVLWQVDDLPGEVVAMACRDNALSILLMGEQLQCWRYEIPSMMLRDRACCNMDGLEKGGLFGFTVTPDSQVLALQQGFQGLEYLCFFQENSPKRLGLETPADMANILWVEQCEEWLLLGYELEQEKIGQCIWVYKVGDNMDGQAVMKLDIANRGHAHAIVKDAKLSYCDSTGQIAMIDMRSGQLVWKHRV